MSLEHIPDAELRAELRRREKARRGMETVSAAQMLGKFWDESFEGKLWTQISDDDLYATANFLWATYQDAVLEWSGRQMRARDPK